MHQNFPKFRAAGKFWKKKSQKVGKFLVLWSDEWWCQLGGAPPSFYHRKKILQPWLMNIITKLNKKKFTKKNQPKIFLKKIWKNAKIFSVFFFSKRASFN